VKYRQSVNHIDMSAGVQGMFISFTILLLILLGPFLPPFSSHV